MKIITEQKEGFFFKRISLSSYRLAQEKKEVGGYTF